eukprot:CAMPEP_0177455858 /NCGR_PEP_ID=MMETSP0369-20130122/12137_1 /TAXON_ID=447022 ORGANISM="Scrippsiella hangoei-like, Strain SHHI-4" /NCGR_SAMPLE_ID=MMETSP0369 /ASSEMBLY_ACC=CAM_ASM_000364 /LENGTH=101 /DNA_ID=CAMNT_0018928769 /DNA_START=208 /DNA_END=513 /DNA_ORIENTATION=+
MLNSSRMCHDNRRGVPLDPIDESEASWTWTSGVLVPEHFNRLHGAVVWPEKLEAPGSGSECPIRLVQGIAGRRKRFRSRHKSKVLPELGHDTLEAASGSAD